MNRLGSCDKVSYLVDKVVERRLINERKTFLEDTKAVLIDSKAVAILTGGIWDETEVLQRNMLQHRVHDVRTVRVLHQLDNVGRQSVNQNLALKQHGISTIENVRRDRQTCSSVVVY